MRAKARLNSSSPAVLAMSSGFGKRWLVDSSQVAQARAASRRTSGSSLVRRM
jgi:hypothetical protein